MIRLISLVFWLLSNCVFGQSLTYVSAPNRIGHIVPNKPIGRTLRANETHQYIASLAKGQYLNATVSQRGIDLRVTVFGPTGVNTLLINSVTDDQEDESIAFEAKTSGIYRIAIKAVKTHAPLGYYVITLHEIVSARVYAARVAEKRRQQKAVVGWLKANAIPLETVEAGHDMADLQPLRTMFSGVHFVGLGEETHGTHEFFQAKHRLIEFLVQGMGFRVLAMEASYAAMQAVNDYVMGSNGHDDGTEVLDRQGFWAWNTEEVRALLEWARAYNVRVSAEKRVKFVGFDNQFNQSGKANLLAYLRRVAPNRVELTNAFFALDLDSLRSALSASEQQAQWQSELNRLQTHYTSLHQFLRSSESILIEKSSRDEYEQMLEYSRLLIQSVDSYSSSVTAGLASRDLFMADNIKRLADREPAGTRFILWAHNGHVATDTNRFFRPMGAYLRQLYGTDYYALGFSFNQGTFQAWEAQPADPSKRLLRPFTAPPALANSVDWYLSQTQQQTYIIDFRATSSTRYVHRWLDTPLLMRSIGSVYAVDADRDFYSPITLRQRFDGLFFTDHSTPSHPNPSIKNVAGRAEK